MHSSEAVAREGGQPVREPVRVDRRQGLRVKRGLTAVTCPCPLGATALATSATPRMCGCATALVAWIMSARLGGGCATWLAAPMMFCVRLECETVNSACGSQKCHVAMP